MYETTQGGDILYLQPELQLCSNPELSAGQQLCQLLTKGSKHQAGSRAGRAQWALKL